MSITTMEGLEAIPVGHQVIVDRNTWVRKEEGLERSGVTIPLAYFESRLTAGNVEDGHRLPPHADEWWLGSTRTYYISEVSETRVFYMSWHRPERVSTLTGESNLNTWTTTSNLRRATGEPEGFEAMMPLIRQLAISQRDARQRQRDYEHLREHPPESPHLTQMRRDARDALAYMNRLSEYLNRD